MQHLQQAQHAHSTKIRLWIVPLKSNLLPMWTGSRAVHRCARNFAVHRLQHAYMNRVGVIKFTFRDAKGLSYGHLNYSKKQNYAYHITLLNGFWEG